MCCCVSLCVVVCCDHVMFVSEASWRTCGRAAAAAPSSTKNSIHAGPFARSHCLNTKSTQLHFTHTHTHTHTLLVPVLFVAAFYCTLSGCVHPSVSESSTKSERRAASLHLCVCVCVCVFRCENVPKPRGCFFFKS